jgi:pyruvate/2-oxoglutarate/acetoin dehydrogenase E1 component
VPLDQETLINSASKTGRVIVIDEGYRSYGATAELSALITENVFYYLHAPVVRIGAMDVPVPFSKPLEFATIPTAEQIVDAARRLMDGEV